MFGLFLLIIINFTQLNRVCCATDRKKKIANRLDII